MGAANVNITRHTIRFRELEWVLKGLVTPYGRVGVGKYSSLVVTKLKHWVPGHWDTDELHCNCGVKVHSQKTPIHYFLQPRCTEKVTAECNWLVR